MINEELLGYFKNRLKQTTDPTERAFAERVVRSLTYAVETDYLLGDRWQRQDGKARKQVSVTANVDLETKAEVVEFAKRRGVAVNRIVKRALMEHMEANKWTD
jgi:hypothetical protein